MHQRFSRKIVREEQSQPRLGRVYPSSPFSGETFVVPAPPKFELLARTELFSGSPATIGNRILRRSGRFLYCVAGSPATSPAHCQLALQGRNNDDAFHQLCVDRFCV